VDALLAVQDRLVALSAEDDTVVRFVSLARVPGGLRAGIALSLRGEDAPREVWDVVCAGPRAHRVSLDDHADVLELPRDHPLLWPHRAPAVQLHFRNTGCDHRAALADLYDRHRALAEDWFSFDAFLRPEHLGAPGGLAAEGPEPLVVAYDAVLRAHGYRTTLLNRRPPARWVAEGSGGRWVEEDQELAVLLVGASYVVASGFAATPADGPRA
jgi:hypothetical protein